MDQIRAKLESKALPAALFTVFLDAIGVAILIPVYAALVLPGKFQIIPAGWTIRDGWDLAAAGVATDYCSFFVQNGKPCDAAGVFTMLTLFSNGLSGTIPSTIGTLTSLVDLCAALRGLS